MNRVIYGDALAALRELPDGLAQVCVTSPPYWGLRDYGVAGQLGLEATPGEYVERLVEIMHEVRRVLRDDGTLWLNLGDSYATNPAGNKEPRTRTESESGTFKIPNQDRRSWQKCITDKLNIPGLKPKDLCGMPWRVAFALQADGWWLRSDIIWSKPNPMPESVTDRPTRSHEYLFLLTKRARYYYDADAIREEHKPESLERAQYPVNAMTGPQTIQGERGAKVSLGGAHKMVPLNPAGRNKRSVWQIATKPFSGAHFATFPPALVEPCILAGSSPQACGECGAPWERVTHGGEGTYQLRKAAGGGKGNQQTGQNPIHGRGVTKDLTPAMRETTGWRATCSHENNDGSGRCVVLDPFAGSGTVGEVAMKHGRDYLLIELNRDYEGLIRSRLGLFYKEEGDESCNQ